MVLVLLADDGIEDNGQAEGVVFNNDSGQLLKVRSGQRLL